MKPAVLLLIALLAGCAHNPAPAAANDPGAQVTAGLARLHAATDRFRTLDSAVAAGYPATSPSCYVEPGAGAMGYHHVNRSLVDRTADVDHPEILLYERGADSSYDLTAVEFIIPYRVWPADSAPPQVAGLGLPLGHVDVLNVWGLHVWAWKNNPNGIFAWWNPDVHCRGDTTRMPEHAH